MLINIGSITRHHMALFLDIARYLLVVFLPLLFLYIMYLMVTKAFRDMGFSTLEAVTIIFISFLLGSGFLDGFVGFTFSSIYLFSYQSWDVGINTGGALIPILLSIYLVLGKKIPGKPLLVAVSLVTVVTFLVTSPVPEKGIVAYFPYWLLPACIASISSVFMLWKDYVKAAPLAYISGTLGVLIGADVFHLPTLLSFTSETTSTAVIGGASVFDMVFITGILAVIVDGLLLYRQRAMVKG